MTDIFGALGMFDDSLAAVSKHFLRFVLSFFEHCDTVRYMAFRSLLWDKTKQSLPQQRLLCFNPRCHSEPVPPRLGAE